MLREDIDAALSALDKGKLAGSLLELLRTSFEKAEGALDLEALRLADSHALSGDAAQQLWYEKIAYMRLRKRLLNAQKSGLAASRAVEGAM